MYTIIMLLKTIIIFQCLAHVVDPVSPTYLSEDQPKKSRKISQVSQLPVCKFACVCQHH